VRGEGLEGLEGWGPGLMLPAAAMEAWGWRGGWHRGSPSWRGGALRSPHPPGGALQRSVIPQAAACSAAVGIPECCSLRAVRVVWAGG